MKIVIVVIWYVGLFNATLLSQHNELAASDIIEKKVYTRDLFNREINIW